MNYMMQLLKRIYNAYYYKREFFVIQDDMGRITGVLKTKKFIWSSWQYGFDYETK